MRVHGSVAASTILLSPEPKKPMIRVQAARPAGGYTAALEFTDGTRRVIDLEPYLRGPVFEPLRRDPAAFAALQVDPQLGTIVWPNGADIDPDVLVEGLLPAAWESGNQ
jgi:hypothetical protein